MFRYAKMTVKILGLFAAALTAAAVVTFLTGSERRFPMVACIYTVAVFAGFFHSAIEQPLARLERTWKVLHKLGASLAVAACMLLMGLTIAATGYGIAVSNVARHQLDVTVFHFLEWLLGVTLLFVVSGFVLSVVAAYFVKMRSKEQS